MLVDRSLAARIEAAEARTCAAVAGIVPGGAVTPIGGGVATFARPGSPLNKVVGLGLGGALDEAALAELEARGPVRVELATVADPAVARLLSSRGYRLEGFEHVLGLALHAGRLPVAEPAVTRAGDDRLWAAISVEGAAHPDETSGHAETFPRAVLEDAIADFVAAAGSLRYLAWLDGEPAAAASQRLDGDVAMLTGAATLPRFRRRGAQRALLAFRLAEAAALGCELACVTTAPATRSQANAQRRGFELLYARALLTRGG